MAHRTTLGVVERAVVEVTQERVVQAAVGGRGTICGSEAVVMGESPKAGFRRRFRRLKAAR